MKKIKLLCLLPIAAMVLSGCEATILGKNYKIDWPWEKNNTQENQEESKEEDDGKYSFEGLSFTDKTITYDGQPHTIDVSGVFPPGTEIDYGESGNEFTSVGTYYVTAIVTCDEFKTVTLTATLTIVKANFKDLTLNSATYTYNGQTRTINVSGELPAGTTVDYGPLGHEFTDPGNYHVTATISCEGYNTEVLEADLTILHADFNGLSMEGYTVTYDGQEHEIAIEGELPAGSTIRYENGNSFTNAGTYDVTAIVSCHGYNDCILNATLIIEKAELEGITFSNQTFLCDNESHSITPDVPTEYQGAVITYDENGNTFSELGSYQVTATVSVENYNDWHGVAYVIITNFDNLSLHNDTITYDGTFHTLQLEGELPEGAIMEYVEGHNGATLPGEYEIQIAVSVEGYEPTIFMATLTIEKAHFEGLSMSNSTVDYDGNSHSVEVNGDVPQGATIDYGPSGNSFILDGTYDISATVSLEGYEDWHGNATLTIVPLEFAGLSLSDSSVQYDGEHHTIELSGQLPAAATFTYDENHDGGTEPGLYDIKGTVSAPGYKPLELSANLIIFAEPYVVADFEGLNDNSLKDNFELKYYNNGWVTPSSASLSITKNQFLGDGDNTMKMSITHQGQYFKVTNTLDLEHRPLTMKYNGIAVDTLIDDPSVGGTTEIKVQLWLKDLPLPAIVASLYPEVYVTWTLDSYCPSNWTHWEIPFSDESLSIQGGEITREQIETFVDFDEVLSDIYKYINKVAILVKPNQLSSYASTYAYIDNIKFITAPLKTKVQAVNVSNKNYTIQSTDDVVYKLDFADGTVRFESINLLNNFAFDGTYVVENNVVTLSMPFDGSNNEEVKLYVSNNGSTLEFVEDLTELESLSQYKDHLEFVGKKLSEHVIVDDFESYDSTGVGFDKSNYDSSKSPIQPLNPVSGLRGAYYGDMFAGASGVPGPIDSGWNIMNAVSGAWLDYMELESGGHSGNCMMFRNKNGNQARYMTYGLMTGEAKAIGKGSTFSFYIKGTKDSLVSSQTANIRVYYVNKITTQNQGGTSHNDFTYVEKIPITEEWTRHEITLKQNRTVYGFQIRPTQANARVYLDDIEIFGEGSPYTEFAYPTISDGKYTSLVNDDILTLSINNNVTSGSFSVNGTKVSDLSATMSNGQVTFKDSASDGSNLTVLADIDKNSLNVKSVSGNASSQFSYLQDLVFSKHANYLADFQNESSSNHTLGDANWMQTYVAEGNTYNSNQDQMNVRAGNNNNIFCNMTTNDNLDFLYTYQNSEVLGLANRFSVDIANDFNNEGHLNLKISLILEDKSEIYIVGDETDYEFIPAKTGDRINGVWYHIEAFDFGIVNVKAIKFDVKSTRSGSDYLYFDNLHLSFDEYAHYTVENYPSWWSDDGAYVYAWAFEEGKPGHWYEGKVVGNNMVFDIPQNCTKASFVRVSDKIIDLSRWNSTTFADMQKWNRSSEISLSGTHSTISPTLGDWFDI